MFIYHKTSRDGRTSTFAQPGREFPISEFMEDGKPKLFDVEFMNGRAEVPESLGRYMIDKGLAQTSIILIEI